MLLSVNYCVYWHLTDGVGVEILVGDLEWLTIMNPQILIFTLHLREPMLFVI